MSSGLGLVSLFGMMCGICFETIDVESCWSCPDCDTKWDICKPCGDREGCVTCRQEARKVKVYISGPMTGLPDLNYPAFFAKEADLVALGYTVINPARAGEDGWTWVEFMRRALVDLSQADAIHLLPGWMDSKGARLEAHIAEQLGLTVMI